MPEASTNGVSRDRHPNAHWDDLWAIELAELNREAGDAPAVGGDRGLLRHLHALRRRYASQTPGELRLDELPEHAEQIRDRYERVLAHVRHMVEPTIAESRELKRRLRQDLELDVYYRSVHRWQSEIFNEMRTSIHYWQWVEAHAHLPHAPLHWRMAPLAVRPIAHPWTCVRPETLESLGRIECDLVL
jgi:hypothetical protein